MFETKYERKKGLSTESYSLFLMIFIVFQPILDILTTFSILVLKINATPGVIIRFLIAAISFFYLIRSKKSRVISIYLVLLLAIIGINLLVTFLAKNPYSLSEEIKSIAKTSYYTILLLSYITAFRDLRENQKLDKYFPGALICAVSIINLVMIIAHFTSSSVSSYMYLKQGESGWFYAGNELGSLLAICLPIVIWYSIDRMKQLKHLYVWIPSALTIYSLLLIGTKVGFGAILISLPLAFISLLFEAIFNREKELNIYYVNAGIIVLLAAAVFFVAPKISVTQNTTIHLDYLAEQQAIKKAETTEKNTTKVKENTNIPEKVDEQKQVEELIYSGRLVYLRQYLDYFKKAPISQKLFGMGYGGNYQDQPKTIEMDFFDIFFQFGIVGCVILVFPLFYYGLKVLKKLIFNLKKALSTKYVLIFAGLALGLGIAVISGHVFTAPAVSIYFVFILGYLVIDLRSE